jgi:glutathione S-transferase
LRLAVILRKTLRFKKVLWPLVKCDATLSSGEKGEAFVYKLYARKGAGSAAIEAMLAICGAPHEIIDVQKQPDGSVPDWFRVVNPRGEVPTLRLTDDSVMTESAAMMLHLADCYPKARLAPDIGTAARALYMRALVYMAANTYSTDLRMYYPERYSTDAADAPRIKAKAIADLNRDFDVFNAFLGEGPFILGQQMTAADVYSAMLISWSEDFAALTKRLPKLQVLYAAVSSHPAVRKAWDRNEMP